MNNSPADRRSPLEPLPGQPTSGLYDRAAEVLRTPYRRFLVIPTGKGFLQVSRNKS